jgi:hypothetical protein
MNKQFLKYLVIAIIAIILLYILVQTYDTNSTGYAMKHYLPSEASKVLDFKKYNEIPSTLEEDMVTKMAPILKNDYSVPLFASDESYKPILNPLHDASPIE